MPSKDTKLILLCQALFSVPLRFCLRSLASSLSSAPIVYRATTSFASTFLIFSKVFLDPRARSPGKPWYHCVFSFQLSFAFPFKEHRFIYIGSYYQIIYSLLTQIGSRLYKIVSVGICLSLMRSKGGSTAMANRRRVRVRHTVKTHTGIFSIFFLIGSILFLPFALLLELVKPDKKRRRYWRSMSNHTNNHLRAIM